MLTSINNYPNWYLQLIFDINNHNISLAQVQICTNITCTSWSTGKIIMKKCEFVKKCKGNVYISAIKTCNYWDNCVDTILRDRIVLGIRDPDTQTQLLKERALTTTVCIAICKAAESATARCHVLSDHDPSLNRVADYKTLNSEKTLSYEKKEVKFWSKIICQNVSIL